MNDHPRLRPVEAFPIQQDGRTLIYLKDPQNFATPIGISPVGYFILSHFDGRHSFLDIQEAYCRKFGALLLSDELSSFIEMLDSHYYIYSERFLRHQKEVIEKFLRESTRAPAHAGRVYKVDAAELKVQLDSFFTSRDGPGLPSRENRARTPKAIVAPHIDFQRGGAGYAWAYKSLAESDGADLYIILGTSHWSGEKPFVLTDKDFFTPLGTVETDRDFTKRLQELSKDDLFADEYLHRTEHSLEFQVVFLKYIAQRRAELLGHKEKPFKMVPILVSSFHPMLQSRTLPENTPAVKSFLNAMQELLGQEKRKVCFVAGVDLAHVGRQFGDSTPLTPDFLKWVEKEDSRLIERLALLDGPGFFQEVAKDQDKRRICGFSPLYSLIQLLSGNRGRNLKYSQAFTPETGSAVTFTSMIFE
jgi:AmmeMemoRadiSam system protein B